MSHACESCSFRYNAYPKTPCKIGNNRFYRNFRSVASNPAAANSTAAFPNYCSPSIDSPLSIQPDPLLPAGSNRPRRKSTRMVGKKPSCVPKKVIQKKKSLKSPSPCPTFHPDTSMPANSSFRGTSFKPPMSTATFRTTSFKPPSVSYRKTQSFKAPPSTASNLCSQNNQCMTAEPSACSTVCSSVVKGEMEPHPGDCGCADCEKNEPCDMNAVDSFIEDQQAQSNFCGDADSIMSKTSEKNLSNYLFDNPSTKSACPKKVSACAELLDCLDEDSEVWILQCPKCFDINKVLNADLGKRVSNVGKALDVCSDRFKSCMNMVCLAPEKATEYKSVCDEIRLIKPVGKIMVTEQDLPPPQSDMTCSEEDPVEDDIGQPSECNPDPCALASKKIQKKLNDQRFTIETTVTVENVPPNDRSSKKSRKSLKAESHESCLPLCPPEPSPAKRKSKRC